MCTLAIVIGCKRQTNVQSTIDSPSASMQSPEFQPAFDNVLADVAYVDDSTCSGCHNEIAESFAMHPMGQSLAPVDAVKMLELFDNKNNRSFDSNNFRYEASFAKGQLSHSRTLLGDGPTISETHNIAFVVGSGQRGRSYLIDRDNHFFMSPLTWYPIKQIWDLSPGYEHNDLGFDRPVLEDCLFCHSNRANIIADQKNKYERPAFTGHAIGCQRCHGPGELHVAEHRSGRAEQGGIDRTIANPAHLEPKLREAVCQQCHLSGAARVVTRGKNRFDFRPGMPLEQVIATYTLNPKLSNDANHFVGQVEQMYASNCFAGSNGTLGCTSCHDPHSVPNDDSKVSFYVARCMECHSDKPCSEPIETRTNTNGVDNCVACHMPAIGTDVRHSASTDHRIPRIANSQRSRTDVASSTPIVAFPNRIRTDDPLDGDRDLAIGLLEASLYHRSKITPKALESMILPLQKSIARTPQDIEAQEALGDLLLRFGRRDAIDYFRAVLQRRPQREHSMVQLASRHLRAQDNDAAVQAWQTICQQHPTMPAYKVRLASALGQAGRWQDVYEVAKKGTSDFETRREFWQLLAESCSELGKDDEARAALSVVKRFAN